MPAANFGLRSRGGRGYSYPSTDSNPWTQTNNKRNTNNLGNAGHTELRSQISNKFFTYCVLALGYDRRKPPPTQPQLVRHVLSVLRHGDDKLAIVPYDTTSKANTICHVTHVPNSPGDFQNSSTTSNGTEPNAELHLNYHYGW